MQETDAWQQFLQTGSVLDYLRYASLKNAREYFNADKNSGNEDAHIVKNNEFKG